VQRPSCRGCAHPAASSSLLHACGPAFSATDAATAPAPCCCRGFGGKPPPLSKRHQCLAASIQQPLPPLPASLAAAATTVLVPHFACAARCCCRQRASPSPAPTARGRRATATRWPQPPRPPSSPCCCSCSCSSCCHCSRRCAVIAAARACSGGRRLRFCRHRPRPPQRAQRAAQVPAHPPWRQPPFDPHLSVALRVGQQVQQELAALDGPAALAGRAALVLGLRRAADAAGEAVERDAALALHHVLQVALGLRQVHLAQGKGGLPGVLEVNTQVAARGLRERGEGVPAGSLGGTAPGAAGQTPLAPRPASAGACLLGASSKPSPPPTGRLMGPARCHTLPKNGCTDSRPAAAARTSCAGARRSRGRRPGPTPGLASGHDPLIISCCPELAGAPPTLALFVSFTLDAL
jgi:hypothetical protein